MIRLSV